MCISLKKSICTNYFSTGFKSRSKQAADSEVKYPRVEVDFTLKNPMAHKNEPLKKSPVIQPFVHTPMEEIAYGPSTWLWDYLRRSGIVCVF